MGLDSSAYGNYPTPFIGIFQILLKKPSYSSSNIFQIPFLRPPSQTINLRSESCLRYRCTWRREMPIFSDICVAFFGLYTILPAPRHPYGTICVSVRLCQAPKRRCRSSPYGCDVLRLHRQDAIVPICPKSNSFLFCSILFFLFVLQSLFLFTCQSAFNLLYIFCWRKVLWNYTTLHKHISNSSIVGNMLLAYTTFS